LVSTSYFLLPTSYFLLPTSYLLHYSIICNLNSTYYLALKYKDRRFVVSGSVLDMGYGLCAVRSTQYGVTLFSTMYGALTNRNYCVTKYV